MISSRPTNRDRFTHVSDMVSHVMNTLSTASDAILDNLSIVLENARLEKQSLDSKSLAMLERMNRALRSSVLTNVQSKTTVSRLQNAVSACISSSVSFRSSTVYMTMKGGESISLEQIVPESQLFTILKDSIIHISEFGSYKFTAKYVTASSERVSLMIGGSQHLPVYEFVSSSLNGSVQVETIWFYTYKRNHPSDQPDVLIEVCCSSPIVFDSSLLTISVI